MELYSSIIDFRQEDVPPKDSRNSKRRTVKVFHKPNTVFRSWKEDDEKTRDQCLLDHDFNYWKLIGMVKDNE